MKTRWDLLLRIAICGIALLLIGASFRLPLWDMTLVAPQYPDGLHITAHGDHVGGDLREVNILNQYIGMKEIAERPAPEMALFPWSIGALLLLVAVAPFNRWVYRLAAFGAIAVPLGILADMQVRLRWYGHHLDHDAPIRLKPFTPLVVGPSHVGQFMTTARLEKGGSFLIGAGLLMIAGLFINRWLHKGGTLARFDARPRVTSTAATFLLFIAFFALAPTARADNSLQQRIDRAAPHATLVVDAGRYAGSIVIRKPLQLIGRGAPVIDAQGHGSVVTINANDVTLRGFVLCNSGQNAIEEAAGVKVRGSRNTIEQNVIRDVHFGIQAYDGEGDRILRNRIRPGRGRGYRGGDGINLWSLRKSTLDRNQISDTRDGIYMSFTSGIVISNNDITRGRYAIHSMFSQQVTIASNRLHDNLLGAALMNSDSLQFRGNRVERQRAGSTPYGVLLKDIGDLVLEQNVFLQNRVAVYADGTPDSPEHHAIIRGNSIVGNDAAFSLQNSVRLVVTENSIVDNLTDVVSEERSLSSDNKWSSNGRGNYWSEYRGFDSNGDGVGEIPYRVEGSFDYLLQRNPLIRAFLYTPAHTALDLAARMFPLFRPDPLITDPDPLVRPPQARKAL